MRSLFLAFVSVAVHAPLCCAEDSNYSQELKQSFQNYLDRVSSITFTSVFRDRIAQESEEFTNSLAQKWKIDSANKRIWRQTQPVAMKNAKPIEYYFEDILTPQTRLEISCNSQVNAVKKVTGYSEVSENDWAHEADFLYLSLPIGYLQIDDKYVPILDLLVSPTSSPDQPGLLVCDTKDYVLTVQLSQTKGAMPARIEFKRKNTSGDEPQTTYCLYQVKQSLNHEGCWLPTKCECTIMNSAGTRILGNNIRLLEENGTYVVVRGDSTIGTDRMKVPEQTLIAEIELSDFELNALTESDFQFATKIPEETSVHLFDRPDDRWVWRNNSVVLTSNR